MYHCGTAPVLMHIGSRMYGAIIVSPREPLRPRRSSCWCRASSTSASDGERRARLRLPEDAVDVPDFVRFNGRPNQYMKEPIRVKLATACASGS